MPGMFEQNEFRPFRVPFQDGDEVSRVRVSDLFVVNRESDRAPVYSSYVSCLFELL